MTASENPFVSPEPSSPARVVAAGKFLRLDGEKIFLHGLAYGPFGPGEVNGGLPPEKTARRDLARIALWGANTLRLYHPPPAWFLDLCAGHGLRVMVSVPWTDHVDFLRDRSDRLEALRAVEQAARQMADRPEVAAILAGNEIPSPLARWLGPRRVQRFLEDLLDAVHQAAPETLASYANYPGTEYLQPGNADFTAFNVYLEDRAAFDRYLARLQNLAGDKPLVISEFGVDARSHGEARQAEILSWQREVCLANGVAGNILFSYTDEWHRGGGPVTGWSFGLTEHDRTPRLAWRALSGGPLRPENLLPWRPPKVSVIVCTYNGSRTLGGCLTSLRRLNYPRYEVIVVDDGSTDDGVREVAESFPEVRYIRQEHAGLSVARNTGAAAATGDIFAWTDDDCMPDEDWLIYLTRALENPAMAAAGGPNVPPRARSLAQACVIAAPGGPAHVLLTDRLAEHVPGCNLAVKRAAFESLGGFLPKYHAAGDDVDFCWRLQEAGGGIGFHAAAMVWHYRRFTARAFLRQQAGYGKAEALLMERHAARFGHTGGARWRGTVYHAAILRMTRFAGRVYTGVFGSAPFQAVYQPSPPDAAWLVTSVPWWLVALASLLAGVWFPLAGVPGALMALTTLAVTGAQAMTLSLPPKWNGVPGRLLLWTLLLAQPLARGWARLWWGLRLGTSPTGGAAGRPWLPRVNPFGFSKRVAEMAFWSAAGTDRETLLPALRRELEEGGFHPEPDDGWRDWDLEVAAGRWWRTRLTTVTEYHGRGRCLTRVRLASRATRGNLVLNSSLAAGFAGLSLFQDVNPLLAAGGFFVWMAIFETGHHSAVGKVARKTRDAALSVGLEPVADPRKQPVLNVSPPGPSNEA